MAGTASATWTSPPWQASTGPGAPGPPWASTATPTPWSTAWCSPAGTAGWSALWRSRGGARCLPTRSTRESMSSPPPPWTGCPRARPLTSAGTCSPPCSGRAPPCTACPWRVTGGTWGTAAPIWTAPATPCPARCGWIWACPSGRRGCGPPGPCPRG